jgi:5,10-methylenetetrahydrofolate reductase
VSEDVNAVHCIVKVHEVDGTDLLSSLRTRSTVAAELRPPRAGLATHEGIDAWIDTYHALRRLTREGTFVFLTDSAVGAEEEDNLRHLAANVGRDTPRPRIVPFLTAKHSLEFCLSYADRARQHGFSTLVVLGGDRSVGAPRSVEHAWQLRRLIQERDRGVVLGGWANPHADADRQLDYLSSPDFHAEFFLTQVVSHHQIGAVSRFLETVNRRGLELPGMFGVFYYRSANPRTLETLRRFMPVPVEALTREFDEGATPEDICARTIRALAEAGARHYYISNLPPTRAQTVLAAILEKVGPLEPAPRS